MAKNRDIFKGAPYGRYDAEKEGHGHSWQWGNAFKEVMSREDADDLLGVESPWVILGIPAGSSFDEVKKAYRKLILENHPDRGGDVKVAQKIIAAYTKLEKGLCA